MSPISDEPDWSEEQPWLVSHEPFSAERLDRLADIPDGLYFHPTQDGHREALLIYEMRGLARSLRSLRKAATALLVDLDGTEQEASWVAQMWDTPQALRALLPEEPK